MLIVIGIKIQHIMIVGQPGTGILLLHRADGKNSLLLQKIVQLVMWQIGNVIVHT